MNIRYSKNLPNQDRIAIEVEVKDSATAGRKTATWLRALVADIEEEMNREAAKK